MKKGRKTTGGKYKKQRKKKKFETKGQKRTTKVSEEEKRKTTKVRGGNVKTLLLKANYINIQKNGKTQKAKIKNVIETPSNRFLARQNILTKGTIIDTDKGKVKITNRPTQEGSVNGVLIEETISK